MVWVQGTANQLAEGGCDGLNEDSFLCRQDGAKVEDQAIGLDAGDYADTRQGAAEPPFELCRGVTGAGDADEFCGEPIGQGLTSADERIALDEFEFDFAESDFGHVSSRRRFSARLLYVAGGYADHLQRRDFRP